MNLTQIPLPAERYFNTFRTKDDIFFEVEITQEDYKKLADPVSLVPQDTNGIWVSSRSGYILGANEYCDNKDGIGFLVSISGGNAINVPKNTIISDALTQAGQDIVTKQTALNPI